ncbi:hypothetical protein FisN_30Lh076 [Fistulifera solaris]|uniref:U4/U6.U5 small nuclear ribonucleoprotein 27kDa protein domain-containing protein n=1 Tax=Fistulifera solaris TaxID=1519565 RepID=A0A1Z5JJ40_FISSO|nr:hypothetical protein FisN_30Lh076 [Fistulifera solaris]|eukprot:GAX13781.1 hypothetical protein FisN_30Lh076 [Fistulifera solaris]
MDRRPPYDHRRDDRYNDAKRRRADRYDGKHNENARRGRERSRSPSEEKGEMLDNKLEEERRARMARLRAENEQEERQIAAALDQDLSNEAAKKKKGPQEQIIEVNPEELEEMDEEEQMRALLGFTSGFGSTKGQKVEDNHTTSAKGAASKNKARKYRQYMNRKHGFNRPLDKMD